MSGERSLFDDQLGTNRALERPAGSALERVERLDGEVRKARVLATLGARHAGRVLRAQRVMLTLLLSRETCTIDDVRAELGELDRRPVWLGAVPAGLRAAGLIARVGFVETTRAVAHARPLSQWGLASRAAAEAWLADTQPTEQNSPAVAAAGPLNDCSQEPEEPEEHSPF